jgi:hypothetical protein
LHPQPAASPCCLASPSSAFWLAFLLLLPLLLLLLVLALALALAMVRPEPQPEHPQRVPLAPVVLLRPA